MFRYERDLVNKFMFYMNLNQNNAIVECPFRWGNIDVVEYKTQSINFLTEKQISVLEDRDNLHIFSLLYRKRPHTVEYLYNNTNLSMDVIERRLNSLIDIDIVKIKNNLYLISEDIDFPDLIVISYEMKLNDIKKALNQAVINKKYSDYSYVVMPESKREICLKYKSIFQECCIGLILVNDKTTKEVIRPKRINANNFYKLQSKIKIASKVNSIKSA